MNIVIGFMRNLWNIYIKGDKMKNYIVVIMTREGSELFSFTSDEDRGEVINECKKMDSYQDYAIATTERVAE